MREETKRRLERQLWLQRAKWVGAGVAVMAAMAAGFWATGLDATVEIAAPADSREATDCCPTF